VTAAAGAAVARVTAPGSGRAGALGSLAPESTAGVLVASLEPAFLAEIAWDPAVRVIAPPPGHRLLQDAGAGRGYARGGNVPGCAVRECERRVTAPGRVLCRELRTVLCRSLSPPQARPLRAA
jgi:hypothetical protein